MIMQCTNSCSVLIGVVRRRGNIRSHSTLSRHERLEDHRSHQQRSGGSHLPGVRLRRRRRPLQSCARTHRKALSTHHQQLNSIQVYNLVNSMKDWCCLQYCVLSVQNKIVNLPPLKVVFSTAINAQSVLILSLCDT